jgi:methylaspartate mutase epsilon subunit
LEELKNQKWTEDFFLAQRKEVLNQWPTGEAVDLSEALEYHHKIPQKKNFGLKMLEADKAQKTLVQPRAGVALIREHIELLQYLEDDDGADLLPTTIDSYTRQNRYQEAQEGIKESRAVGRSMLNGFPAVNHGVAACRQVVEAVKSPLQVRHGTPDARLLAEITLAGGFTSYEGGGISYNIPYAKDILLEQSILWWQYVDRLVGYYEEKGITINREPFGPLTGTLVPPCISHVVAIIEALLAAEQGVKNITVGYGQCGNLIQDIAAIYTLKELCEQYLTDFGYRDFNVTTVFHQWMGGFPQDENMAFGVISWGAVTAALSNATKVIVKTPHEAIGVPTKEANRAGIKTTKQVINMLKDQMLENTPGLDIEKDMIRKETKAIIEKVLELGEGDVAQGAVRAIKAGIIDVPFAPSRCNAGKIIPVRDNHGAVRILDMGNIPMTQEIREFHTEKIAERGRAELREPSFQMVINDIYAIGKGMLVGKPK